MKQICFLLLACALIAGCSKSSSEEKDRDAPVILLVTPINNNVYTGSQNLSIDGTILDDNIISEVHYHVYNSVTNALLVDIHRNPGDRGYTMFETISVVAGNQYRIQIIAKDKFANEAITTVNITVN
jgi:hypothetical protein